MMRILANREHSFWFNVNTYSGRTWTPILVPLITEVWWWQRPHW